MSQTKQWSANKGLATRMNADGSSHQGAGGSTRTYTGRYGGKDYVSYLKFALDWTDVGQIVSAVLNLYTDDGLGAMDSTTTETPTVSIRRLKADQPFSEGSDNSAFITGDYDSAIGTSSDQVMKVMSRATFGLTQIDITAMVEDWAPTNVKRRSGLAGSAATNNGIKLYGPTDTKKNWAGFSEDYSDSLYRPFITLTYEYGVTVPDAPTNLTPSGAVTSLENFEGDFNDTKPEDYLAYTSVEVYTSAATNAGQTVTGGTRVFTATPQASNAERIAAHFNFIPDDLNLAVNTTYKWRARVKDNEGQWSLWTDLVSFSVSNTAPNAPTLDSPAAAASYSTLDGAPFVGSFVDSDAGDTLEAYQIQLSAYAEGSALWNDDEYILWNTGKRYASPEETGLAQFSTTYGGSALTAGTYYWRARVWDNHQTVGAWTYRQIIVTDSFAPEPDGTQTAIQIRPKAPWRVVIRDMFETDGVTRKTGRGLGNIVAVLEDAKNIGASKVYNSPGELHFTLGINHPQIATLEPRQTHYSVQTRQGDGWREWTAGLMMDFDATDTDVVFYGTDYLGLLGTQYDERYDASNPDLPVPTGSKYVNKTLGYIVRDQLSRAISQTNSPLGFITINQNLAAYEALMPEKVTVFSTYVNIMDFVMGLIDSHRAGTGKRTMLSVRQVTGGGYEFYLDDDPGTQRDNLRLRYGELAQGFRVIPFGKDWASKIAGIGRSKDGIRVMYSSQSASADDSFEETWGHFIQAKLFDGVSDENDLIRRVKQAALHAGKLGKNIAIGLRNSVLKPFDGYSLCDQFFVDIDYGPINTDDFGSGYWVCVGVTWTVDAKSKRETVTLSLTPRDDDDLPENDLLEQLPINPQAEWQIDWVPPDVFGATAAHYLDQSTGIRYDLQDDGTYEQQMADPRNNNLLVNSGFEMTPIATVLTKVWTLTADWATATSTENLATGTGTLGMTTSTY